MKKLLFKSLLCLGILFFCSKLSAQSEDPITINEAVNLIHASQSDVYSFLQTIKQYSYVRMDYKDKNGFAETFKRDYHIGLATLHSSCNVHFNNSLEGNFLNHRLTTMGWMASIVYASTFINDCEQIGFIYDSGNSSSIVQIYRSESKKLMICLWDHSDEGYIFVTIGRSTK